MDFPWRNTSSSFNKPSNASSSSHKQSQSCSIPSYVCNRPDCEDDNSNLEHHPILSHHNDAIAAGDFSMSPPAGGGQVIIKVDVDNSTVDFDQNNAQNRNNDSPIWQGEPSASSSSSGNNLIRRDQRHHHLHSNSPLSGGGGDEFSFRRPDEHEDQEDPTSKLIGQFLEQQRVTGEMSLDMDMDMDHELLRHQHEQHQQQQQQQQQQHLHHRRQLPPLAPDSLSRHSWSRYTSDVAQSPDYASCNYKNTASLSSNNNHNNSSSNFDGAKEIRVSFQESDLPRRRSSVYSTVEEDSSSSTTGDDDNINDDDSSRMGVGGARVRSRRTSHRDRDRDRNRGGGTTAEVLRCTSSGSLRRVPSISMSKTKSRLIDPPTPVDRRSSGIPNRSGPMNMRSGLLGKSMMDEDEDDPFFEEDLPEDYKGGRIGTLLVLEWVSLVLLVGAFICSLIIPVLKTKTLWNLRLWKWEVLVLALICGRLVSGWGIRIIVFFIERNFLLRKRVLYFVYGLKKAVVNVIWLGLVLVTWHLLFDKRVEREASSEPVKVVTTILIVGEVGAVLWLLKTLLIKVCASTFHVNAFFDRIQESLFNQFVIETLSGPPLFEFQQTQEDAERTMAAVQMLQNGGVNVPPDLKATILPRTKSGSGKSLPDNNQNQSGKILGGSISGTPYKSPIGQSTRLSGPISKKYDEPGITIDHLHKLNQKNVSAWNMKRLMRIVRHGVLTTLDEQIVEKTAQEDESATQIRSEVEAKAAARKIFRNVAKPRSRYIYLVDLMRFMREDEVLKTLSLFEGASESERISKSALRNWVVNAFRERRALALTLSDTKTAVNKLHKMVNVIVSIIIILIGIISLNIITSKSLLFLSSQIVVVAFVFGNTCKNVFESIIFLFVIHPFDVGDRCEIDGVQMVVEEMNILTTVFLRYDNQKIVFPNYILLTKPINNFYRSPDMGDGVEFCVHIATPAEKIAQIRQRITSYIENKKEHWYPSPMIILKDAENLNMLRMAVWIQHRMNHQDMGEKWLRRALLVEECVKIFRDVDLDYRLYPLNVAYNPMPSPNIPYPSLNVALNPMSSSLPLPLNNNFPPQSPPTTESKHVIHPSTSNSN